MIYELAMVAHANLVDKDINSLVEMVNEVVKSHGGETLVQDDWGTRTLAQATARGVKKGRYLYFIYRGDCNVELARKMKINEGVFRYLFVQLGEDDKAGQIVKAYKTPFSKRYHGSVAEGLDENEIDDMTGDTKDRRRFARKRGCWFTAKNIKSDWKDPDTYCWLISEFGKISPARISGVSRKHQRFVNAAIKRARQLGIASRLSNKIAE